jgi:phosphoribosylformylglycinamidine (FGAM) synthase-like enzyme
MSSGGLAVCVAEAALAGGLGATLTLGEGDPHRWLFAESPSRALLSCAPGSVARILELARRCGAPCSVVGRVGGDELVFGELAIDLAEAARVYERALPQKLKQHSGT